MRVSKMFFRPGGTMDPSAPSYIERGADTALFQALEAGEYAYVLDSRQFGKSSLVARVIVKLREAGTTAVKLDLQRVGANVTPEQFYAGLLDNIASDLGLCDPLFDHWRDHADLGPLARMFRAIEDVLLAQTTAPIVIIFDEIDFVRALSFSTDELFAKIRDCYNRRAENPDLKRLTFCLVGVATPSQLVQNPEITPFNIGTRIDLRDFRPAEMAPYAKAFEELGRPGGVLTERVFYWVEGHPYLTQLICSRIETDQSIRSAGDVDALIKRTLLTPEARQTEPNLADVERRLLDSRGRGPGSEELRTRVLELYGRMLAGQAINADDESPITATLRLSGLSKVEGGRLQVRNRLYRAVFNEAWRRQNLPDFEVRRVRAAARRSMLRTATVAGLVLTMVSALAVRGQLLSSERAAALGALSKRTQDLKALNDRQQATLEELRQQEADLLRVSGDRQRSIEALERRTKELRTVSGQREEYLAKVTKSADELRGLSAERAQVIQNLEQKTDALSRQTYNTRMANISLGLQLGDSRRVMQELRALAHIKDAPFELGHARLRAVPPEFTAEVPRLSRFELDETGAIEVVSLRGHYVLGPSGQLKESKWTPFVDPQDSSEKWRDIFVRRGPYRVWTFYYVDTLRDVIADAATNEIIIRGEKGGKIMDVDARSRTYLAFRFSEPQVLQVRRIPSSEVTLTLALDEKIRDARFNRLGGIIVKMESELRRFDSSGKELARVKLGSGEIAGVIEWAPDQSRFACTVFVPASGESWVELRDAETLEVVYRSSRVKATLTAVAVSEDSQRVATGALDGRIFEYVLRSGQPGREIYQLPNFCNGLHYRGNYLYSLSRMGDLAAWRSPVAPAQWSEPDAQARTAAVVDGGRAVAWIDTEWNWPIEDLQTGQRRSKQLPIEEKALVEWNAPYATISGRAPYTYFPGPNGSVGRLHHETLKIELSPPVSKEQLTGVTILATGGLICGTMTRDSASGAILRKFAVLDERTFAVRFTYESPVNASFDRVGRFLQVDVGAKALTLRTQTTGEPVARLTLPMEILEATLSADGKRAAIAFRKAEGFDYPNAEIWLYEVPSMRRMGTLVGPRGPYWRPALSPDGRRLWAMNNHGDVQLFDVDRRTRIRSLGDNQGRTSRNQAGDRLAGVVGAKEIRLWDVETGDELMSLPMNGKPGSLLMDRDRTVFSRDGKTLVAVGNDGAVHVFFSEPLSPRPAASKSRKPAP